MIIHLTHLLHLWRGPEYVGVLFPDEVDMLNLASLERAQVKEVKIDGRHNGQHYLSFPPLYFNWGVEAWEFWGGL